MRNLNSLSLDVILPKVDAEDLYSRRLRVHVMNGDAMKPTLNPGDMAMIAPVHQYVGEGYYVVDFTGYPNLYRVHHGEERGKVTLSHDNSTCRGVQNITREYFDEHVIGKVVALVHVLDGETFSGRRSFV